MEVSDEAPMLLASDQEEKVARIFARFDEDRDEVLKKVNES